MNWHSIARCGWLTKSEKAVALALANRTNGAGVCWPSLALIRQESGYRSPRTVQTALRGLVFHGVLSVEERPGTSSLYRLREPDPNAAQLQLFAGEGGQKLRVPPSKIAGVPRSGGTPKPKEKPKAEAKKENPPAALLRPPGYGGQAARAGDGDFSGEAFSLFVERYGQEPAWNTSDFVQVAGLRQRLPNLTVEEFRRRYRNFLASTEEFTRHQAGRLRYFCSNFDRFLEGPVEAFFRDQREQENRREAHAGSLQGGCGAPLPDAALARAEPPPARCPVADRAWDVILAELHRAINPQTYATWFKATRAVRFVGENGTSRLQVWAPTRVSQMWLASEDGMNALRKVTEQRVEFIHDQPADRNVRPTNSSEVKA